MTEIRASVIAACSSMAHEDVTWYGPTSYEFDNEEGTEQSGMVENAIYGTERSTYLDYVAKVLGCVRGFSPAIKLPKIAANRHSFNRAKRVARSARPAVRQTFAARKAKAADSGGGSDSDGPCRPQHTDQNRNTLNPALSTVRNGGAK